MEDWKLEPAHDLGLPMTERLRSLRRESGLVETIGHHGFWASVRAYLKSWHRLRIEGRENLPAEGPFVLAANHSSHLDALVLASCVPARLRDNVFPIAAGDTFFNTPVNAIFAAGFLNALPMWRKHAGPQAMRELRQRLVDEACGYIIFPEGTRTRDGTINRFKAGLGMVVAGTRVPVIPCYLKGTFQALPPHRAVPRPRKIILRVGKSLLFDTCDNDRAGWERVAQALEAGVRELAQES